MWRKDNGVSFSHLWTALLEHCPLSEHREDNAYQLVRRCEDCFLEWFPLVPLLHVVGFKGGVMLNSIGSPQPTHSSEMPVAPLRDSTGPLELP